MSYVTVQLEEDLPEEMELSSETVKSLREQGYKVHVYHERKVVPSTVMSEIVVNEGTDNEYSFDVFMPKLDEKGGKTHVSLISPDGREATGIAKCWKGGEVVIQRMSGIHRSNEPGDSYCKKTGVAIALTRALKALNASG